ncbi:MAG: PIG-L family deacetylase [Anaerolineales bacterium]|nr:PIG-L family deacetylase [Anaerolineales bacterium]
MPSSALTHIFLSPHLDDAVLSCGGMIYSRVRGGARAVVVSLCTANPPPGPLSLFAQSLHERWTADAGRRLTPPEMAAARRTEDLEALAELGAEAVHLDVPDCIYRLNPATNWPLYTSDQAIFGSLHAAELTLVRRVATRLATLLRGFGRHHLYVPLSAGHHVDHQLARRAAETAGGIHAYYEDYPYVAQAGERWPNPSQTMAHDRPLTPEFVRLSEADLTAKVAAIGRYASQLSTFWASAEAMDQAVRRFANQTGGEAPAERIWRPSA